MFQHILIPVDFTAKNAGALEVALKLAHQDQARITLMHVVEPIEYEDDEIRSFYQTLEAKAWEHMKSMVEHLDPSDISVIEHIVIGHRVPCIVQYVTDNSVDLVVLNSHPIDFDQLPTSWSTLSYQLSIFCPCPVFLLK